MKLAYDAISASGAAVSDVLEASTIDEAMDVLRAQGLFVTQIEPAKERQTRKKKTSGAKSGFSLRSRTQRLKLVSLFSRQLNVLIATGTPLADGLAAMERQTKDEEFKSEIGLIRQSVEQGSTLHEALGHSPRYFDEVYRNIIKAGECAGALPTMLDRLAVLTRKQVQVRTQISNAMIYPCVLIMISVAVLAIMLTVVMPRFTGMFETLDVPLPATTQILMAASGFIKSKWWMILVAAIGLGFAARHAINTTAGKQAIDRMMLALPTLSSVTRAYATARIARLLGVLIECNVPLLESLQLVRNATGNAEYERMMVQAEQTVVSGEPVSTAFADDSLIEPALYEAIRNGEQTGKMSLLMLTVADFMDEENDSRLKALTSLFEPLILVALGLMVGGIAISMFMPMFDLTATAGG